MKPFKSQLGFTLIEMLLALAIFAMLGMATYTVLNNTVTGHEAVKEQNKHLTELHRAMTIIDSDFAQLAQRYARINGEQPSTKLFHAQEYMFDSEAMGFAFVRDGWTNPAMVLPRSEMQPVAYRTIEGELQRLYFNFVDPDSGAEPRVQPLMTGISELSLQFMVNNAWVEELENDALPQLIKLRFKSEIWGEIERVFPIVSQTYKAPTN